MVNKRKKKKIKTLFYNNKYIELKNKINIYSEKIPLYNSFINNYSKKTNSWYDMNIYESYIIDNNNYTFKDYEFNKPKKLLKCEKIILNPTEKIEIKTPKTGKKVTQKVFDEIEEKKMKSMMNENN